MRFFTSSALLALSATVAVLGSTQTVQAADISSTSGDLISLQVRYEVPRELLYLFRADRQSSSKQHIQKRKITWPSLDGTLLNTVERTPLIGYLVSAGFALRRDWDRCVRSAAKCTGSTCSLTLDMVVGQFLEDSTQHAALPIVLGSRATMAALDASLPTIIESAVADHIRNETIREACATADLKTVVSEAAAAAVVGAVPIDYLINYLTQETKALIHKHTGLGEPAAEKYAGRAIGGIPVDKPTTFKDTFFKMLHPFTRKNATALLPGWMLGKGKEIAITVSNKLKSRLISWTVRETFLEVYGRVRDRYWPAENKTEAANSTSINATEISSSTTIIPTTTVLVTTTATTATATPTDTIAKTVRVPVQNNPFRAQLREAAELVQQSTKKDIAAAKKAAAAEAEAAKLDEAAQKAAASRSSRGCKPKQNKKMNRARR